MFIHKWRCYFAIDKYGIVAWRLPQFSLLNQNYRFDEKKIITKTVEDLKEENQIDIFVQL